jgi:CubicO group peptidase (beta-lactamase class C family)
MTKPFHPAHPCPSATARMVATALALAALTAGASSAAPQPPSAAALPRSTPEAQGIPASAILAFVEGAEAKVDAVHSFVVVRHGHVVAEGWWSPYAREIPHVLFSLSKSFTSTAVGLAIADEKMSLEDPVLPYFPEDAPPEPGDNLKAMRVRDLLEMSAGHHAEDLDKFSFDGPERLTKAFLALPVAHKPGTHFLYNTPGTYMLSAIVQKATGQTVLDYLRPRLFEPLGIENPTWDASPQGISFGGFGLSLRTEEIARFGQLYLQKGVWQGKRLIPAEWVAAATARQTSNGSNPTSDWDQGYGYQFWRCRHGLYRGDGAFGQFCIVMPEEDAVVAITSGTPDMQSVMNLVWDHLLAGMGKGALPPDPHGDQALRRRLAALSLPPQEGQASTPTASLVSGKTYAFRPNDDGMESVALDTSGDGATLVIRRAGLESRVICGHGAWRKGGAFRANGVESPVSSSGAWTAADTYTARLCAYETPFVATLTLRFKDDQLIFDVAYNVALGRNTAQRPQLVGRMASED